MKNCVFYSSFSFVWIFTLEKLCLHLEFITPQNEWKQKYIQQKQNQHRPSCQHKEWKIVSFSYSCSLKRIQCIAFWSWTSPFFDRKIKLGEIIRAGWKMNLFLLESFVVQIFIFILAAVKISESKIHTSLIATTSIASKPKRNQN